jgi:hypothetical protein
VSIVTSTSECRAKSGEAVDPIALAEWLLRLPRAVVLEPLHHTDMRGDSGAFAGLKATWSGDL